MTRKDYEAIARVIDKTRAEALNGTAEYSVIRGAVCALKMVAEDFAACAEQDNPRFDRARFLTACGF